MTTIEATAELIQGMISPQTSDEPRIELEDIIEAAKNAYQEYLWTLYMSILQGEGERSIFEGLTNSHSYPWAGGAPILTEDINIINLPRDAGLHSVVLVDDQNQPWGEPLVKTTSLNAHKNRRLSVGVRVYRDNNKMYFPDAVPDCIKAVHITFAGMFERELTPISREAAKAVEEALEKKYIPSRNIPVDVNKNLQPE